MQQRMPLGPIALAWLVVAPGCGRDGQRAGEAAPRPRLVVFGPALTSMAFDLGLGDHVVGIDQHSSTPAGEPRPVVGSALSVRVEPILAVRPDVLVVCLSPSLFEPVRLVAPEVRIEHFDFRSLEDIAAAMERLASLCGKRGLGTVSARAFRERLAAVRARTEGLDRPRVLFAIGFEEPLAVGGGDFVDEVIDVAGGKNALASVHSGWKRLSIETVVREAPDVLVCQCEPGREAEARSYWGAVGGAAGARAPRVAVVTDPRWTLPAPHLADLAADLAAILHEVPEAPEGAR